MKKLTQKEVNEIIKKHQLWLNDKKSGKQAKFDDMNLDGLDLSNSNLEDAYFSGTDLVGANLENCNLRSCQMSYADLSFANLKNCNLQHADLGSCILSHTNLENCDLNMARLDIFNLHIHTKIDGAKLYGYVLRKEDEQ